MNHPGALYNLGVIAVENNGVAPDFPKAAGYFRRAAELGYPDAAYALALCYRQGRGVPQDDAMAARWMKLPRTRIRSRPRSNMRSCSSTVSASSRTSTRRRSSS